MGDNHDLTHKVGAYLDRHLVFPLLEFLSTKNIYNEDELLQGKLELLQETNMVDFLKDEYQRLHNTNDVPEELLAKRNDVVRQLREYEASTEGIMAAFQDQEFQDIAGKTRDGASLVKYLSDNFDITAEDLQALYPYAKFQYECENYAGAGQYLYFYRVLVQTTKLTQ